MTAFASKIHVGMPEFLEPTLLVIGDAESIGCLAGMLRARVNVSLGEEMTRRRAAVLRICAVDDDSELIQRGRQFTWSLSARDAESVAQQFVALASSKAPAHAYVEFAEPSIGIEFLISIGEYDPERIFE
jgi:hypothetical protein